MKKLAFLIPILLLGACKTIDDKNIDKATTLRVYNASGKLIFAMPSSNEPFIIKLNGDISIQLTDSNTEKKVEEETKNSETKK